MNSREQEVKKKYEQQGWRVLRSGSPDFVMLKVVDGDIQDMKMVEVKSPCGRLTYEQGVYKKIAQKAGIPYIVEVVE